MITLVRVVFPTPAEHMGNGTLVVIRHLLFAARIHFLLLASHHVALVLIIVGGLQECPVLVLGLTPDELAHVAGILPVLSRALSLVPTALTTALAARTIGVSVLT